MSSYSPFSQRYTSALGGDAFPCPFDDVASLHMPDTIPLALRWAEYIASSDGLYLRAVDRVLSYFITDPEIDGVGDDEKEEWTDYLGTTLDLKNFLHTSGLDALIYGNSFVSVMPRFNRYLSCPKCRIEHPLQLVYNQPAFRFNWSGFKFTARCQRCEFQGAWKHIDRRTAEKERCCVKRWNPHDMDILWDPMTEDCRYIWKIPEDYRRQVREGKLFHLERAPWEVITAVRDNQHLLFDEGFVYHMREDALAGIRNRGWGISRVLANFRQTWYVQVLRRYNEAIALDYVIPFRLLTPAPGDKGAGTDPLTGLNMGNASGRVRAMLRQHRRDPSTWHFLPFAIQYQTLGGEAKQLAPVDLMNQGIEVLLNNIGIPADLYKGSLQLQTAPMALRTFESTWSTLPHNMNGLIRFLVEQVARIMGWEEPTVKLERVSHADDVARQQAKLQLMMGGQISQTSGLKAVGLDFHDETRRQMDDQKYQAEQQAKLQQTMDAAAQMSQMSAPPQQGAPAGPGGAPAGGAPAGGAPAQGGQPAQPNTPQAGAAQGVASQTTRGPNDKVTIQELMDQANQLANQLMAMPPSQRSSELRKLRQSNPGIHPYVTDRMEALRTDAARQGQSAVLSQQFGVQH